MNGYNLLSSKEKDTRLYIALGIIGGLLLFICPAFLFYLAITAIIAYFIYNRAGDSEKDFILRIFFFALFLRFIFIMITHILSNCYGFGPKLWLFPGMEGGAIFGDEGAIHRGSWALAKIVSGIEITPKEAKNLFTFREYSWSLHYYLLAFFYYLFGYVPILGKCINALAGVLTGMTVYFISKELFGKRTAKLACALTMFYPTLFLWSIANLKDTILIFLLTFTAYIYILSFKRKRIVFLFLLPVLIILIAYYRFSLLLPLIFIAAFYLIINIRLKYKKFVVLVSILIFLLNSQAIYKHYNDYMKTKQSKISISKLIGIQRGNAKSGGTVYKIYPERFYDMNKPEPITIKEFVVSLFKGTLSLMFKPFPWEIEKKSQLFYYPVSIIWNFLFVFFIIGSLVSIRCQIKSVIFLQTLFIIIILFYSLIEGNVGTVLRHRDMVTPIYLIFSSFGIVHLFVLKQFGGDDNEKG
ncbi:MAG: glycosyltransferase family 39 protein [Candidatus Omnitrophica bacterium]|nr:glycosyltransferase family 39 protein [Candidatus Omnitrophota bacterium]